MPTNLPQKITIDIGQIFLLLPQIQKFIADVSNQGVSMPEKIHVVGEFIEKLLASSEAITSTDFLDNDKFNAFVESLIILTITGIDSYQKLQVLIQSTHH